MFAGREGAATRRASRPQRTREHWDKMSQIDPDSTLKPSQIKALEQLIQGSSATTAADAAGVSRSTLQRWLRTDYDFLAAYNAIRQSLLDDCETRLLALADRSVEVVASALEEGDARIALNILKGIGFMDGQRPEVGPSDPVLLRQAEENRDAEREVQEAQRIRSLEFERLVAGI